jgi:serine/threonine protein kinase
MIDDRVLDHLRDIAVGDRYELLDEIGLGGMGTVYRARDTRLDRVVALKVIDTGPIDEARTLARLEHPGIVPVYDTGVLPDGRTYYAMRLVTGQRLDEYARGEPSLPARLRVFGKICEAVAFAHDRGVVHCDLKPANIMTGAFGEVFVMDWGIANHAAAGTPGYRAPEATPTARSDVFSLGRILEDLGPLPRPLAAVAARASAAPPEARYGSATELAAEVERFLDALPVEAYREGPSEAALRFARRNHVLLLLLATYLVVKFALVLLFRR